MAVDAEYRLPPSVVVVEPVTGAGPTGEAPPVRFSSERHELAVPAMAAVYVGQLLDRDEFRRHCDRFSTRAAILGNLR